VSFHLSLQLVKTSFTDSMSWDLGRKQLACDYIDSINSKIAKVPINIAT
jgi:hypothetical protein